MMNTQQAFTDFTQLSAQLQRAKVQQFLEKLRGVDILFDKLYSYSKERGDEMSLFANRLVYQYLLGVYENMKSSTQKVYDSEQKQQQDFIHKLSQQEDYDAQKIESILTNL